MCMCLHVPSASFLCAQWPLGKLFSVTLFSTYQHTPLLCAQCPAHPVNHVCPVNTHCVFNQCSWFLPQCIALFNQCCCVVYTPQPVNGWTPFISAQQQESPSVPPHPIPMQFNCVLLHWTILQITLCSFYYSRTVVRDTQYPPEPQSGQQLPLDSLLSGAKY